MTKEKIYNDCKERSETAGKRGNLLACMCVLLLAGQLAGGSCYAVFFILGAGGIAYLLLSMLQALWQAVAMWTFKQRLKDKALDDYPNWIGFGAWTFYLLKMTVITAVATCGIMMMV